MLIHVRKKKKSVYVRRGACGSGKSPFLVQKLNAGKEPKGKEESIGGRLSAETKREIFFFRDEKPAFSASRLTTLKKPLLAPRKEKENEKVYRKGMMIKI